MGNYFVKELSPDEINEIKENNIEKERKSLNKQMNIIITKIFKKIKKDLKLNFYFSVEIQTSYEFDKNFVDKILTDNVKRLELKQWNVCLIRGKSYHGQKNFKIKKKGDTRYHSYQLHIKSELNLEIINKYAVVYITQRKIYPQKSCVICLDSYPKYYCQPCGHFVVCEECRSDDLSDCPICRRKILKLTEATTQLN